MKGYSSREIIRILQKNGWEVCDRKAMYYQLLHPEKGAITVPYNASRGVEGYNPLSPKSVNAIEKQSGLLFDKIS